jgi:hypothetical protein
LFLNNPVLPEKSAFGRDVKQPSLVITDSREKGRFTESRSRSRRVSRLRGSESASKARGGDKKEKDFEDFSPVPLVNFELFFHERVAGAELEICSTRNPALTERWDS